MDEEAEKKTKKEEEAEKTESTRRCVTSFTP
jgi:hypothetical protein